MQSVIVQRIFANVRVFLMLLLALLLSLYVAWMTNAQLGYGYSWLYQVYGIESHIAEYAPQNRFREDFELTSTDDHKRIFQQIVDSVHGSVGDSGKALSAIKYTVSKKTFPVLHKAEIIHLQDVAVLIQRIHLLAAVSLFFFILFFNWHYRSEISYKCRKKPNIKQENINKAVASLKGVFSVFLVLVVAIVVLFLSIGAKDIFYQMHVWIFPDKHQWFFYYQDSLMSTLMKAPDLFGGIALQILLLGVIIFSTIIFFFSKSQFKKNRI